MKFEDIRKLHQKKFREEFGFFLRRGRTPGAGARRRRRPRRAPADQRDLLYARVFALGQRAADARHQFARHMAQISETRSPQGIAAVVPLLAAAGAAAGRTGHLPARDPGSRQSRHHPAHAGLVRELPLPAQSRQRGCAQWQGGARQHGRDFHVPVEFDVPLDALPARFARIAWLDLRASRSRRRHSASSTATSSATRRAACRARRWRH